MSLLTLRELSEREVSSAMKRRFFRPTETVSKLIGYLNKVNVYMSPLRRMRRPDDIPVTILGLSDEDGSFESSVAEEKLRRVLRRNAALCGQPSEALVRTEKRSLGGKCNRYELTAGVRSPRPIYAESAGCELLTVFDDV